MATQRYEFVEGASSKYWEVAAEGSTLTVSYGRIGTKGRTTTKELGSAAAATKEAAKLIAQKTKKGYALVSGASKVESTTRPAPKKNVASKKKTAPRKAAAKKNAARKQAKKGAHETGAASSLTPLLADISEALTTLYPDSYEGRAEPADPKLFDALASVPPQLRELYAWMDGCPDFLHTADDDGMDWLDLDHALDERRLLLKLAGEGKTTFEDHLLPLFGDGSGDFFCADLNSGDDEVTLWRFFHEEPATRKPRAKLSYLLKLTASAMKKGRWGSGFEGEAGAERRAKEHKKFEAMMKKLDAGKPNFAKVQGFVRVLLQTGAFEAAFQLAEKAAGCGQPAKSLKFENTVALAGVMVLPTLSNTRRYDELLRVSEAVVKVRAYADNFDAWRFHFGALNALGKGKSKAAKAALNKARNQARSSREEMLARAKKSRVARRQNGSARRSCGGAACRAHVPRGVRQKRGARCAC